MSVERTRERSCASAVLAAGVAGYALNVARDDILGDPRGPLQTAFARQVAMYLTHVAFELSLARVAEGFGRDRSTVAHACHVIEDRREDEAFDDWLSALEAALREAPAPQRALTVEHVP